MVVTLFVSEGSNRGTESDVGGFLQQFQFLRPGWGDLVEVLFVTFILYRILLLLQQTRAMQMLLGLLLLAGIYIAAIVLDFTLIRTLLETLLQYGAIAALVVFQPELRAALARLGQSRLVRLLGSAQESRVVDELVEAAERLARNRHGAIIAVQREVGLKDFAETGSSVDARVSAEMISTIFAPRSPLHDGAIIVAGDTIQAAGAILPLTQNPLSDRSLGTRHRAAIGLSEECDAVVIVVSEETARISVAYRGRLEVGVDSERLRTLLEGPPLDARKGLRLSPLTS